MPWIASDWLDRKNEAASYRDAKRSERWQAASWWQKIMIWLDGDSPNGANHRSDWR